MSKEAKPTHYFVAVLILLALSLFSFTSVYSAPTETNQPSFWKTIYCNTIGDWFNSPRCPLREDIDMVEYNTVTLVDDEPNTQINNTDTNKTESNPPSIDKVIINRDSPTTISPTNTKTPIFDLSILNNYVTKDYLSSHTSNTNSSDYVTRDFLSRQVGAIGDSFGRSLSDLSTRLTALIPSTASITNWDSFFTTPSTRILAGTNLSWDGNTLNATGGSSSSGVSLSLSNNIFGQSSLAPTTTQNLAISGTGTSTFSGGLESWRQISSPYFQATSTTATSTFAGGLSVSGSSGFTVLQNGNVGMGTNLPKAKLHVGNGTVNNSIDAQVLISRNVDDSISGNGHAFSDSSNISRSGVIGYNSFDGRITISGTQNFDHYVPFQSAPTYSSAGTMTNLYGFFHSPTVTNGNILNSYGAFISNPDVSGGSIGNNYGLFIGGNASIGTSTNYAIYTQGLATSSLGGPLVVGGKLTANSTLNVSATTTLSNLTVSSRAGFGTTNPTSPVHILVGTGSGSSEVLSIERGGGYGGASLYNYYNDSNNWGMYIGAKANYASTVYNTIAINSKLGNLGVGTSTPWGRLSVNGNANGTMPLFVVASSTATFATSTAFIIDSSGKVGIATTTPWRTLGVTGTVGLDGITASTGAGSICLSATKELVYNAGSDACLPSLRSTKHDINNLSTSSLSTLNLLTPVSFIYNQGDNRTRYGFIAEDVSQIDTHLATYNDKGEISGIDDRAIIALAIGSIKELDIKLRNIITSVGEWVFNKITATLGVFERVETKTFESDSVKSNSIETKGIQMTDKVTGQIYCISLSGGNLDKSIGPCSTATTTTIISPTPSPEPSPTVTPDPTPTPTPSTTPLPDSLTPSPDPTITPVPEPTPTVEPVETVSREPVNIPVTEPNSQPISESTSSETTE